MTVQTPGTAGISQVSIAATGVEVLITVGNNVMRLTDMGGGQYRCETTPQWLSTLSMSPQLALQLHQRLGEVLMDYAQKFGPIPCGTSAVSRQDVN